MGQVYALKKFSHTQRRYMSQTISLQSKINEILRGHCNVMKINNGLKTKQVPFSSDSQINAEIFPFSCMVEVRY